MSSKRLVLDPVKQCVGKLAFKSRAAATRMISHRLGKDPDTHLMEPYCCPHCGSWHYGHRRGSGRAFFVPAIALKPWIVRRSIREEREDTIERQEEPPTEQPEPLAEQGECLE